MTEAVAFIAGVVAAVVAVAPAAVVVVLQQRQQLRRLSAIQAECDEWRGAAANASSQARYLTALAERDEADDSGEDWKDGG